MHSSYQKIIGLKYNCMQSLKNHRPSKRIIGEISIWPKLGLSFPDRTLRAVNFPIPEQRQNIIACKNVFKSIYVKSNNQYLKIIS